MRIYHATFDTNLPSIHENGICTRFSKGKTATVWGVKWSMRFWAFQHCCRRHGWPPRPPVLIELEVDEKDLYRFKGGLFYSVLDWRPEQIVRVWTHEELCGSPTEEAA